MSQRLFFIISILFFSILSIQGIILMNAIKLGVYKNAGIALGGLIFVSIHYAYLLGVRLIDMLNKD